MTGTLLTRRVTISTAPQLTDSLSHLLVTAFVKLADRRIEVDRARTSYLRIVAVRTSRSCGSSNLIPSVSVPDAAAASSMNRYALCSMM
jgi:hypothetical protein